MSDVDDSNYIQFTGGDIIQQRVFLGRVLPAGDDSLRMYIFVNNDLGMGKGKIAAQVGHAVQKITDRILRDHFVRNDDTAYKIYTEWIQMGAKKVVLKVNTVELEKITTIGGCCKIHDAGHTQIPSGSLTVVAFLPCLPVSEFDCYKLL
jgi:PTH2 family peptidyl-tRNA hydrolase